MTRYFSTIGLTAGLIVGGAAAASAAILDFTDASTPFVGSISGANYTVTGVPVAPNNDQLFDGNTAEASGDLALERDGLGITDDEITNNGVAESVTITFDRNVTLTGVDFLDLFEAPGGSSEEVVELFVDGAPVLLSFGAFQVKSGDNPGYAFADVIVSGMEFSFFSGGSNDNFGEPDYALAALRIAPIPLPAGALLLGTALAGFGVARRRKA